MAHAELTDDQLRHAWRALAAQDWGSFDEAMKITLRMARVRLHARLLADGVRIAQPAAGVPVAAVAPLRPARYAAAAAASSTPPPGWGSLRVPSHQPVLDGKRLASGERGD